MSGASCAAAIRPSFLALISLASLLPVLAVVLLFPTPAIDLREHINWGATFPLYTWKHPPLQSWLVGLVALTSLRDAWPYVALSQALNLVGLYYIVQTASQFIDVEAAIPVGTAFCGLISFSLGVPDMALNADLIQVPIWLGLLYHVLRAPATIAGSIGSQQHSCGAGNLGQILFSPV